jgi:hypothetical protein
MRRLKGRNVRRLTSAILRRLTRVYEPHFDRVFRLRDVDACLRFIKRQGEEGRKANLKNLDESLSLTHLSISCIGLLALSMYREKHKSQIFPVNWLNESGRPNANHVLQCMLAQLANYSLSAALSLEIGLDNPARALCRVISELSEQVLVLAYSRDDFKSYIKGKDPKSSTAIWYTLFAKGKLNRRLNEIETKLGFGAEITSYMSSMRRSNNEFYSQAVHHSYIASMVGAQRSKFGGSDLRLGVFGGENSTIEPTVNYLNFSLWSFLISFFAILDKHHRLHPQHPEDSFWMEAFMLYFCVKETFLLTYIADFVRDRDAKRQTG